MHPSRFTSWLPLLLTGLLAMHGLAREERAEPPFPRPRIQLPQIPAADFLITTFGAKPDSGFDNSTSLRRAIAACHQAGGGRVVVPEGQWSTGAVHLLSRVNLHLQKGAELIFSDDPKAYLPAVQSSWEGMECYNYSPLIYAFEAEDVAITGEGVLRAETGTWQRWFSRPPAHLEALKKLYTMASTGVPVAERQMAQPGYHLRPQFIQFNRCRRVLVEGIRIRRSPFWTIHPLLCDSVTIRHVDIWAKGHNNDGVDPEMTRNLLIEHCTFDQGDDAIAIKSGRNHDAWRLNRPTENVIIRHCTMRGGHQLVAIGSELSGGIRNVHVHDCRVEGSDAKSAPYHLLFIKTNRRRGGVVENIYFENIRAPRVQKAVLGIETDVLYQWKDLVPTYEERLTPIRGIHLRHIRVGRSGEPFRILGDPELPVDGVALSAITIDQVDSRRSTLAHVRDLQYEALQAGEEPLELKVEP